MIVIDTNVIISALYSNRGASYLLVSKCLEGKIDFSVSPLIALEYYGKIHEKTSEGLIKLKIEESMIVLKRIIEVSYKIKDPILKRPYLPDDADDKILECAISSKSSEIITFNKRDFPTELLNPLKIKIVTPKQFLIKTGDI